MSNSLLIEILAKFCSLALPPKKRKFPKERRSLLSSFNKQPPNPKNEVTQPYIHTSISITHEIIQIIEQQTIVDQSFTKMDYLRKWILVKFCSRTCFVNNDWMLVLFVFCHWFKFLFVYICHIQQTDYTAWNFKPFRIYFLTASCTCSHFLR